MVHYKSVNCYIVDIRVIDLEIISTLFWIYMEPGQFHMEPGHIYIVIV